MADLLVDDEKGKATLSAAQFNLALIFKSLAMEQSLKILILPENGNHLRGHNLSILFSKLPDTAQNPIRREVAINAEIKEPYFDKY